jgi:hypothetical protein
MVVPLFDQAWYVSSVKHTAVAQFAAATAYTAGQLIRQLTAPAVNSERVFVCITSGTSGTEPSWTLTRGAKNTSTTPVFQECTGHPATNGDVASTTASSSVRSQAITLGAIIKNNSATHFFICSTAGTAGASEPTYNTTAGVTTTDGSCTYTCLGPVGNFPAWGAPHARLANAYATNWGAAGHKFYLADNHAETQSTAVTLTSPATAAAGATYVVCVDRTVALPPVVANYNTGATISTTGSTSITFTFGGANNGTAYYQGVSFSVGDGSSGASLLAFNLAGVYYSFKNCAFVIVNSSATSAIVPGIAAGTSPHQILWDNCTAQFAAAAQSIKLQNVNFEWKNTPSAIQGGTLPATLFGLQTNGLASYAVCRGVDFSAFSGQFLASNQGTPFPFVCEDCKFHASMTRYGTSTASGYASAPLITVRCDSGATNYKSTRDEYAGTQTTETSITRVGGATDGTTATSIKIATNAQAAFLTPYRMLRLAAWNDVTGANRTVTVCGTINSPSLPLNDEIWMDVQYLGSSGSPIASLKTTCKSHPLATGAAVASDGSTWNGMPAYTTFNGTPSGAVTVSNGGRTVTHGNTSNGVGVASTAQLLTGKYYFEITATVLALGDGCGISTTGASWVDPTSSVSNGLGIMPGPTTLIYNNGSSTLINLGATVQGDVFGFATDLTARFGWIRRNNGNWNADPTANPVTGIGGLAITSGAMSPFVRFSNTAATVAWTGNFGQASYANPAPSGFDNWAIGWSPFKLVAALTSPQPQMKGYIYASIRAAKPSTTYYIDPQIAIS